MGIITQTMLSKKKFLGRLAEQTLGTDLGIVDEMTFLDPATIDVIISCLQSKYKEIREQLLQDIQRVELKEQLDDLEELMAFYASNSFVNLSWCEQLLKDKQTSFKECISALQCYEAGDKQQAFARLASYFNQASKPPHHFLINKVFGELLTENGYREKGIAYLKLALQTRPEDRQCYQILARVYKEMGEWDKVRRLEECLTMIG